MARILIAEDDDDTRQTVRDLLKSNNYDVLEATDGVEALDTVKSAKPDALVLDIVMPRMEGWEVVEKIRQQNSNLPILVLSALQSENDLVRALDAGADDYVEKPYRNAELLARLRAVMRRTTKPGGAGNGAGGSGGSHAESSRVIPETPVESETIKVAGNNLVITMMPRSVTSRGQRAHLTPTEFEVLVFLARRAGQVVLLEDIIQGIWGRDHTGGADKVRLNIYSLRQKLELNPNEPEYLRTVRGQGYILEP